MKPQRKPHFKPLATALAATLQIAAIAAVPLAWDVRPGQPAPVMFDRYHGETIEFAATFRGFGELPFAGDADIRLWYQTNGMGSSWWSAPAAIQSNVITAVWSPEMDPGADRVSLFFGAPSNAYAAAVLRLRHSPGFRPGAMPDPESFRETDPVFSAWLAGYTPPDTSLEPATNYTDAAARAATNYTDAVAAGLAPTNHGHAQITDGTNTIAATREVYEVAQTTTDWVFEYVSTGSEGGTLQPPYSNKIYIYWCDEDDPVAYGGAGWYVGSDSGPASEPYSTDQDLDRISTGINLPTDWGMGDWQDFEFVATRRVAGKTYPVGRLALTNDLPDTAEIERDLTDLRTETSLVYRLYSGSNVVAEVTNYNSAVHAPELRLMQLNESNEYFTVWTETNGLARTLAAARQYTDDATNALPATFAPRAWGRTTSGLGFDAPEGMTWVSTSNLVIAGGLEYEQHVTSGGAIWLLESNGMTADFHASGNNTAYLDISAGDGTSIFRIEKTDSFLVGVSVDNVSVDGNTLVCGVNVVASEHPLVRVKEKLSDASWVKEEDGIPASLATVAWSGSAGNWTCRIQNNTGGSTLFAQMEYLQEGGTKIVNTAPIDVTPGILCTDGIHKVRPVYDNGSITWEVVP